MTGASRSKSEYNVGLTSIFLGRDGPKEEWLIAELLDLVKSGRSDADIATHLKSQGAVTSDSIAAGIDRARSIVTFQEASAALAAGQHDAPVLQQAKERTCKIIVADSPRLRPILQTRLSKLGASDALIDYLNDTADVREAVKSSAQFTTLLGGLMLLIGVVMPLFQDGWSIYAILFVLAGIVLLAAGWKSRDSG